MRPIVSILGFWCLAAAAFAADPPTFNRQVVRIFQQHCQSCHHPGDIAPFSLMDYQSSRPYAPSIKSRVLDHSMPPWKPVQGVGDFRDARVLSQQEIESIRQWVDAGVPEGDPNDLPAALTFSDGWALGRPDLVLAMPEYAVPAGQDIYRCFSLPTELVQDRYVNALEIHPGNRAVVHHVLLFPDAAGQSKALDDADPGPGYTCFGGPGFVPVGSAFDPFPSFFGGWVPGLRPSFSDAGTAMQLPKGSRVVMQVHYHPKGESPTDRTQVGLYFTSGTVDKIVRILPLLNTTFRIPAGNPHYAVQASMTLPRGLGLNTHIVSIAPHMHLLGREISAQATLPDRQVVPLIRIDDWDFDWQGVYDYLQPVAVPEGSRVEFTAYYDNSSQNPRNPNSPPQDVAWGERTTDEMALVFFGFTLDAEHLTAPQISAGGVVNSASFAGGALAPGAIVSLFGVGFSSAWESARDLPLPHRLAGGTRVTVNGVETPLFYASPSQINFQVPFELPAGGATLAVARGDDGKTGSVAVTIGEVQPGIFTDANGAAAAVHALSGAAVGAANPGAREEWISVYATGLGRVTPAVQSGAKPAGLSTTVNPVKVTVGGLEAEVSFAGLAPDFAGLYQVNFRIPRDVSPGSEVPLRITISGAQSNITKLAVQ